MKKFGICFALVFSILLMFVSCGDDKAEDPAKFYKKIVESEVTDLKSGLKIGYNLSKLKMKCSATVNIQKKGKEYLSVFLDGTDMSWLNSVKLGMDYSLTGEKIAMNVEAGVNKANVSVNAYMDDDVFAIRIPELKKNYFGISIAELDIFNGLDYKAFLNDYLNYLTTFSDEKEIAVIVDKFKDIYLQYVKVVDFKNDDVLTVNGVSQKCKVLTVELSDDNLKNFLVDMLDLLSTDEYIVSTLNGIFEMYESFGLGYLSDTFQKTLDELTDNLMYEDFDDTGIQMILYVDSDDKVCGRTILIKDGYSSPEEIASIKLAKDKSNYMLDVSILDEIKLQSEGTVSANSYTGECKILDGYNKELISFNIDKLKVDSRKKQITGKIIYAPTDGYLPKGMAITVDFSNKTSVVVSVLENQESLADLIIEAKLGSSSSVSKPKEVAMVNINNEAEIMGYISDMNFENLKKVVSDIGMPNELTETANSLIDYYLLTANLN